MRLSADPSIGANVLKLFSDSQIFLVTTIVCFNPGFFVPLVFRSQQTQQRRALMCQVTLILRIRPDDLAKVTDSVSLFVCFSIILEKN